MDQAERLATLDALQQEAAGCTRCRLAEGRTQVVFGVGDPNADLMFVGEAPGFHEDKQGFPFVGQAGKLLDKLLAGIGLERADVYIANVIKCRPPGNRDPVPDEIEACEPYLFRQIELIEPRVIATLGNFATKLLSGKQLGITRVHGQEQDVTLGGRRVLLYPLYHPAAALYTPSMLTVLEEDFARLPALLDRSRVGPAEPEPEPELAVPRRRPSSSAFLIVTHELLPRRPRRPAPGSARNFAPGTSSSSPASWARARRRSSAAPAGRSGSTQPVTSPTYTIGNRYEGRVAVSHLDLYRLAEVGDADWAGLEPYFEDAVVFVEWPEAGAGRLPTPRATVRLSHAGGNRRTIDVRSLT